jgi:hypothetical protein
LAPGDLLRTASGAKVAVTSVTPAGHAEVVYNFQVRNLHTYFVGDSAETAVLVHNDECKSSPDSKQDGGGVGARFVEWQMKQSAGTLVLSGLPSVTSVPRPTVDELNREFASGDMEKYNKDLKLVLPEDLKRDSEQRAARAQQLALWEEQQWIDAHKEEYERAKAEWQKQNEQRERVRKAIASRATLRPAYRTEGDAIVANWLALTAQAENGDWNAGMMLLFGPGGLGENGLVTASGFGGGFSVPPTEIRLETPFPRGGYRPPFGTLRGIPDSPPMNYRGAVRPTGGEGLAFGLTQLEREAIVAQRPPRYRKGVPEKIWEDAKDKDGKVFDPHTGEELTWDRSRSRDGQWDMGHLKENSYEQLRQQFIDGEISWKEFLDEYNNTANYRPEGRGPNRGRRHQ